MSELAVLGLGSNRSLFLENGLELEPVSILNEVVSEIKKLFISNFKVSSIYKTKAMYYENQQDFYNMAVCGVFDGTPKELLFKINSIEQKFGRDRKKEFRNGPRTIDIDIELFGNMIIKETFLQIPHKKLNERQFVLFPMLEILPNCAEPITRTLYSTILSKLSDQGVERL
ncbi:MAG: 2-amino-4-hydroxy-6-hydroxymethyldihydropteridine diphosphokinase [Treponemataceae bacterium]